MVRGRGETRRDVHVDGMLWNLISSQLASFLSSPTVIFVADEGRLPAAATHGWGVLRALSSWLH